MRWSLILVSYGIGAFTTALNRAWGINLVPSWWVGLPLLFLTAVAIDALAPRRKFWHGFLFVVFNFLGGVQAALIVTSPPYGRFDITPLFALGVTILACMWGGLLGGLVVLAGWAKSRRLRTTVLGGG